MSKPVTGFSSVAKRQRDKNEKGLHPYIKGLYRLVGANCYKIYSNDTLTTGLIECPDGWVDNWIRYAAVEGKEMSFGFDAPERIPGYIKVLLRVTIRMRLDANEVMEQEVTKDVQ